MGEYPLRDRLSLISPAVGVVRPLVLASTRWSRGLLLMADVSQPTAKAWLSILESTFIVFRLPAWHTNLHRRLVKAPELHFYDTGLACWLLWIRSSEQRMTHPLGGAIFETWVVSEIIKHRTNRSETTRLYHYRDAH